MDVEQSLSPIDVSQDPYAKTSLDIYWNKRSRQKLIDIRFANLDLDELSQLLRQDRFYFNKQLTKVKKQPKVTEVRTFSLLVLFLISTLLTATLTLLVLFLLYKFI